ncbi:hypothetical protein BK126_22120 [Paenibacillus sp. FSL H7-0326]|uniref:glycerophosphodiester phosphodiesterase family protein n=1 Tax=Paenibacillus sp. FSL H7-0326 TaxID=1921144 RepID=UPI00096DC661|nr:glycerophosphodiester phosphodiesterase family protein [Paenibacillus sp. FSL H7-0326]OMC65404.1 hypothetical protein BK126_22120 [Paenibacillus sp. FSL H7-0326]
MKKRMYFLVPFSFTLLFSTLPYHTINANAATVSEAVYQNPEVQEVNGQAAIKSLAHEKGYVLATSGQAISLNSIILNAAYDDLTEEQITGDKLTWTSNRDAIEITEDTMTAHQNGVYPLTVTREGASANVLLVVKGEDEEEYVLYEEDFNDQADGSIPQDWSKLSSTTDEEISVKSGALEIDGRGNNSGGKGVLLPEYLGLFGNYKIEADVSHLAANDNSRWHSIMYRVQNHSYPYYQMAVRQNSTAANGVEFAERTPENAWNVAAKNSFSEAIAADQMYRYTVIAQGNRVQELINDELLIDTDLATHYSTGRIGFQAAGSLTKVDNIKVTLHTEALPEVVQPGDNFTHVEEPETNISLAPTIVTEVDSSEDLQSIVEGTRPATAILHVNSRLQVTDEAGSVIDELGSVIETLDQTVIPAFAIEEEATIVPLTDYLKSIDLEDAFVLSDRPELVKKTREAYPIIRGIIEYPVSGELSEEQLMDIRRTTNSHLAKIVLLPESAGSIENISYLQKKLMTVWVEEDSNTAATNVDIHRMITSGTNGMVTDQYKEAVNALSFYDENVTLARTPFIFAHRGIPGLAPENTLEGAKLSYEKGATHIENDIYLSKDGHIVIMHDETIDRTTNGTGKVESYTLAELEQFLANDQFPEAYPDARIPTLRQFFEEFKGKKDVEHIVEIKTGNPAIIDKLVSLIEEIGVENQVSVISFNASQLLLLAEQMPGMSIGYLTSGIANETDVYPSLRSTLNTVQNLNSTFNTSYGGLGVNFLEAAKHRGVTVWPWTYRDEALFTDHFLLGIYGLTTDYAHWASEWASRITPKQAEFKLNAGESTEIKAMIETYDRQTKDIAPEIVVIDGEDKVEVNGNVVTAQAEGTIHAMLRYTQQVSVDKSYHIYTQPITITVKADNKPPAKPKVNPVADNSTTVSGTAEAGSTVYVKAGKTVLGEAITNSEGNFSINIPAQKAGTELSVYAVDQGGNTSSLEKIKIIDKTPPSMPEVNEITIKKMSGKAESDTTVYVYNGKKLVGKASVNRKGEFSVSLKNSKKGDVLTVYAEDKAGNVSLKNNVKVN